MKRQICLLAVPVSLFLIVCCPVFASSLSPSEWSYRRQIEFSSSGTLSLYQVKITLDTMSLISAGKMRPDCGDVRFTDSDKVLLLPHWLESGCNTRATVFWVKVPSISSGKVIYAYYGKNSASSAGSGDETFLFFDGFDASSIDRSKWNALDCASASGGQAHLQASADVCVLESANNAPNEGVMHVKARRGNQETGNGPMISVSYTDYLSAFQSEAEYKSGKWAIYFQKPVPTAVYGGSIDTDYHIFRYAYSSTGRLYYAYIDSSLLAKDNLFSAGSLSKIYFMAGSVFGGYDAADSYYDYIFIRKYADPEPSANVKDEETFGSTTTTSSTSTTTTTTTTQAGTTTSSSAVTSSSTTTTTQTTTTISFTSTTTTSTSTTTIAAYDICRDCCNIGKISCSIICGSSTNTINPPGMITDCSYDGSTATIKSGSNTQRVNCINGRCSGSVSTTAGTSTTLGTTTTLVSTTLSTTSSSTTTTAINLTTTLISTTTMGSSTTTSISIVASTSTTTTTETTINQSTTFGSTTTSKISTTTRPSHDPNDGGHDDPTPSTQTETTTQVHYITSTTGNPEVAVSSASSSTIETHTIPTTSFIASQSWDLFDYILPKNKSAENETSPSENTQNITNPLFIVSFLFILLIFIAGYRKKRKEEKSLADKEATDQVAAKVSASGIDSRTVDEEKKTIK